MLQLLFPIDGKCCKDAKSQEENASPFYYPTKRLLGSNSSSKMGMLLSDSNSCHVKALLLQAALTVGTNGRNSATIVTQKPWADIPFDSEGGIHGMPQLCHQNLSRVNFVYPANYAELVHYLAALGGLPSDMPDLLVIEDIGSFIDDKEEEEEQKQLTKILACLRELCEQRNEEKFSVLASLKVENVPSDVSKLFLFADQIWSLTEEEDEERHLRLSSPKLGQLETYHVDFYFDSTKRLYALKSIGRSVSYFGN